MLRPVFLLAIITGATALSDYWYSVYGCHPPSSIRARFELMATDQDRNMDGMITGDDLLIDDLAYDFDGDTHRIYQWEFVFHWRCRYGWSEHYNRYVFQLLDANKDGIWVVGAVSFSTTGEQLRNRVTNRFKTYCAEWNNKQKDCWKLNVENLDNYGNFSRPLEFI